MSLIARRSGTVPFQLQDPDETLIHKIDFADWFATGDAISSATWEITPSGPTVVDKGESGTVISATVTGCTRGKIYRLTCKMVSNDGETGHQSIAIRCDHK